jgi:dihydrofolate synthase/folylpolyglutamate synthase
MSGKTVPEIFLSANRFGIRLGLERMSALMNILDNPQKGLSYIHVAGTNGKGSVVSYIASVLAASGQKVGVYTSPYLERFSERIRILDGKEGLLKYHSNDAYGEIPEEALERIGGRIAEAVDRMLFEGQEHPTEFELVTAAAFVYFSEQQCDCVVLETGLGGRLDSTNIIENPLCSVITAIGYDHMDCLGETIGQIATEKAGIIKPGCPVFLLSAQDALLTERDAREVEDVISKICEERQSPLFVVSSGDILLRTPAEGGQYLELSFLSDPVYIGLIGHHQALNAALAARAIVSSVPETVLRYGLSQAVWKGRSERIVKNPMVILDGAHNPQGMEAFCLALNESYGAKFLENPPRMIMGVMRDKDYPEMVRILMRTISFSLREVICVTVDQKRSLPGPTLADAFTKEILECSSFYNRMPSMYNIQGNIHSFEDAKEACSDALSRSRIDGAPIICVGSLYLIGQVRAVFLMNREELN